MFRRKRACGLGGVGGGEKNNNVTNRAERGTSLTERHNYQLHCYWKDIADKVTAGELKFNKQTHGKNKKKLSRTAPFLWDSKRLDMLLQTARD